jgi:predicted lipid-binding transport protein (Tim44 family)
VAAAAQARAGGGKSFGSRGSRTYAAPPATVTAFSAAPITQSMTDKRALNANAAASAQRGRFDGWRSLLVGGVVAAGLASASAFGAVANVLGILLQFALIGASIYLVVGFLKSRNQPALAPVRGAASPRRATANRSAFGFNGGAAASTVSLAIGKETFATFARLLGEIQRAYARGDGDDLGARTTPEMFAHLSQDLYDNAMPDRRNAVCEVNLLRGELSEAWRENDTDYATVALRFSLSDAPVDDDADRVVSGERGRSAEATELWTFRRDDRFRDDGWQLSAIQQAG